MKRSPNSRGAESFPLVNNLSRRRMIDLFGSGLTSGLVFINVVMLAND